LVATGLTEKFHLKSNAGMAKYAHIQPLLSCAIRKVPRNIVRLSIDGMSHFGTLKFDTSANAIQ
jgi:hypothetical protein